LRQRHGTATPRCPAMRSAHTQPSASAGLVHNTSNGHLRRGNKGARQGEIMATFTRSDDLQGAEFVGADLRGARFVEADLSGVGMRGVQVEGADIEAPWLPEGDSFLRVNGADVTPLIEAELNRRFPGRANRRAGDPDGLRAAWAALERTW